MKAQNVGASPYHAGRGERVARPRKMRDYEVGRSLFCCMFVLTHCFGLVWVFERFVLFFLILTKSRWATYVESWVDAMLPLDHVADVSDKSPTEPEGTDVPEGPRNSETSGKIFQDKSDDDDHDERRAEALLERLMLGLRTSVGDRHTSLRVATLKMDACVFVHRGGQRGGNGKFGMGFGGCFRFSFFSAVCVASRRVASPSPALSLDPLTFCWCTRYTTHRMASTSHSSPKSSATAFQARF